MRRLGEDEIRAFLTTGTRTGKLGITRLDGRPMVVPVWFAVDDDGTRRSGERMRSEQRRSGGAGGSEKTGQHVLTPDEGVNGNSLAVTRWLQSMRFRRVG